jgi:hypothetical protein
VATVEQEQQNSNTLAYPLAHHSNKSDLSRKRKLATRVDPAKRKRGPKSIATNGSITHPEFKKSLGIKKKYNAQEVDNAEGQSLSWVSNKPVCMNGTTRCIE